MQLSNLRTKKQLLRKLRKKTRVLTLAVAILTWTRFWMMVGSSRIRSNSGNLNKKKMRQNLKKVRKKSMIRKLTTK